MREQQFRIICGVWSKDKLNHSAQPRVAPAGLTDWWAVLSLRPQSRLVMSPVCSHERGGEGRPHSFMEEEVVLHLITPSCRKRSILPRGGGERAASPYSFMHVKEEVHQLLLLLLTPSCRRCTFRCSPSAAAPPSAWWRSYWRWSARNCKCWRSSGRFLGAPDTRQRAGPWSPSNSYLMMSETGLRPHHLNLYAATFTGNDIAIRCDFPTLIYCCQKQQTRLIKYYNKQ